MKLTGTLTNGTYTYTLPSNTGTLALTSDIPSLTGYVTLDTAQTITAAKTFLTSGSSDTLIINHSSGSGIALNITKGGNGEGLYVNKTSGSGNAATIIGTLNATTLVKSGGTSSQYLMADGSVSTLTNPITGTGANGQVAFWNGTNTQTGDNGLFWDNVNKRLGIGTNAPSYSVSHIGTIGVASFFSQRDFGFQTFAQITERASFIAYTSSLTTGLAIGNTEGAVRIQGFNALPATSARPIYLQSLGGNVGIGTTTDAGFRLDVNGTARVQGVLTTTADAVVNGVSVGRGGGSITINTRVGGSALNANTTGTENSAFGVDSLRFNTEGINNSGFGVDSLRSNTIGNNNVAIGVRSLPNNINGSGNVSLGFSAARFIADGVTALTIANNSVFLGGGSRANADNQTNQIVIGASAIGLGSNTTVIGNTSTTFGRWYGNLLLGTSANTGQQLQVVGASLLNGLSTIQGTTASDTAPLGAELLTTGTGDASWTGTAFATGYTHVAGSTTTLTSTLAGVVNTYYQITYTVTGRTAGSFTVAFGGQSFAGLTATGAVGPIATTTDTLVIIPTSDFNGTIVLSIKTIGTSSASVTFNNSAGVVTNQIRISSINTNTFIGLDAGSRNTTGGNNTANGVSALRNNTTGSSNTANGLNALFSNTTGGSNTANGVNALQSNTTGGNNTANGVSALRNNTTGSSNTANGLNALFSNTTGGSNTANGVNALQSNTTGGNNTAFGFLALGLNTTGIGNTATGYQSLYNNTTGGSNSFFGNNSGFNNTTGSSNTANGVNALFNNTTGSSNTANGLNALFNNTTGGNNVVLGTNAGRYAGSGTTAMTSVNNSIYLGYQTRGLNATGSTNEIVIGFDVVGLGSNTTLIGNSSTTLTSLYGAVITGGTSANASAQLQVDSTTKGFLPPRMTTTQKNAIASPATGLMVYDTTLNKLAVYTGMVWETITSI
jgi:hypothetical protein